SVVILRAFPGAITDSNTTLDVWQVVADGMIALGAALAAIPFTAAAGAALEAAGHFLSDVKVPQEREVLNILKEAVDAVIKVWDNDGKGVAWIILKVLAKLGDLLAYLSPVIAQWTAYEVYKANLAPGETGQAFLLPLYPKMPACKGKFKD